MAAQGIVILSRVLNWVASRTWLRGSSKDLVATQREAKQIAKPLTRYLLKRLDMGDLPIGERRDLIRIGLATGNYGSRAAAGEPGGSMQREEAEAQLEAVLEAPPTRPIQSTWQSAPSDPFAGPAGSPGIVDVGE